MLGGKKASSHFLTSQKHFCQKVIIIVSCMSRL